MTVSLKESGAMPVGGGVIGGGAVIRGRLACLWALSPPTSAATVRDGVTSAVLTFGGRPRFFGTLPLAFFVLAVEPGWRWDDGPAAGGV
jgi:hypothetical protein